MLEAVVKPGNRTLLVYALSAAGAAAVSAVRGREGTEVLQDALVQGLIVGTVVNGALFLAGPREEAEQALTNASEFGHRLTVNGIELLSQIDTDQLYAELNRDGVKVMPVPDNPSLIIQDAV